jgi:Zn-dependent M16 (insulinase) family peptidase
MILAEMETDIVTVIFCSSERYPHRGYLDTLACRCMSSGTNAYTMNDHTAYTLTTAGAEGMSQVLPVYLMHILEPALRDEQFLTEVFHWDADVKQQGVVYSEMAARENTLEDLVSRQ